ncbi:MAG: hypothetical protein MUE60_11590 [Candidatus Eisenbacteria bacterium]|nr:hypothetical protein [Candidatus Eisenbacteria bacterium]
MPWAEHPKNTHHADGRQGFPPLSGFCFAHRVSAFGYPAVASIRQALLLCDELVVGVSASPDPFTRVLDAWSRREPRLRLVPLDLDEPPPGGAGIEWWHMAYAGALESCTSDWVCRLDLDEFFHENDVPVITGAIHLAAARGAAALKTSFREVTADWRLAVEPSPFDQIRIWHRHRATPAWDGSQAVPAGPVLDLTRVRCWHLDLLLPPRLRSVKLARSYSAHFPGVVTACRDPLFKHQLLEEQAPEAFGALAWRRPERLVCLGGLAAYPRALRLVPRWLTRFTHPAAERLLAGSEPVPGAEFPLPGLDGAP